MLVLSSPSDPNNPTLESRLLTGAAHPDVVDKLLSDVEQSRQKVISEVNERLHDFVNTIEGLGGINFSEPYSSDSSTVGSEKLFKGIKQIQSTWNHIQSTFGRLNNALTKAKDFGVSDEYLATGLNAIDFRTKTGLDALMYMESAIQASVDTFLEKASQLMKSGDQLISNIESYEEKKKTWEMVETIMSFVTLATAGTGMVKGIFKGARSFMKKSGEAVTAKQAADTARNAATKELEKLNRMNGHPHGMLKVQQRKLVLQTQKTAGDEQVKFLAIQKEVSKVRNNLIEVAGIKPVDWSATSVRTSLSTVNKYKQNPSKVNTEIKEKVTDFINRGDSSLLQQSESFKRFHKTFIDLCIEYSWKTNSYTRVSESENNGHLTYKQEVYRNAARTKSTTSKEYQKIKWQMVEDAKKLNERNDDYFYYVKDDKEEYPLALKNKYSLTLNKLYTGSYIPVTHRDVLVKGHQDTDKPPKVDNSKYKWCPRGDC
ncbi:hypothetical protein H0A36_27545 [Endozoicomonas sp. SM1973]|uniref:Uncharacterized protein n=1 Tax=Spartinivicinus marinus TaxID=2994442 RepID=A0A853I777_9GAMM|nr:hypothetical protein [Spartinivicinus marinus]MCX4025957.1 hypothetical protein [Spartinivicinus marinus]NYZ69770.1 hypothetical protein [Spartinivicinus marinus]